MNKKFVFIGLGHMGSALVSGMITRGYDKTRVRATDPSPEKITQWASTLDIITSSDNREAARWADVVVLAVKPDKVREVLSEIQSEIKGKILVSIAAGIPLSVLNGWGSQVIRAMPNLPAVLGYGMTGVYTEIIDPKLRAPVQTLFESVGKMVWVERENLLDVMTAVSGSGPAYFFLLMEALEKAASHLGLSPEVAKYIVQQTALGAAHLAATGSSAQLRQQVTSPKGTTAAAMHILESQQVAQHIENAVYAAYQRCRELMLESS